MKIIIPMAGKGSRFPPDQYDVPKPLIDILGRSMISRAIESLGFDGEFLFVVKENEYLDETIEELNKLDVRVDIRIVKDYTEGPACSAILFKEVIDNDEELVIANCDQIMEWDVNHFLRNVREYDGAVVTYHTDTDKNSYAQLDSNFLVKRIVEKEVISNISLNGIHYWKKGKYFVESCEAMIANNDRSSNGEFYIGPSYNYMIEMGYRVGIYHIPNQFHHPVGVPFDLNRYIEHEKSKII